MRAFECVDRIAVSAAAPGWPAIRRRGRRRSARLFIRAAIGGCLALGLSGCTAGTIGIALGIYSLSGKEGGGGAVNLAPLAPSNIEVRRESGEIVAIEYDLLDDDGGALTVAFAWWANDAPQEVFPASGRNGRRAGADAGEVDGDGAQRVRVEPNRLTRFRFEWRAREDIRRRLADPDSEGVSAAKVMVRITSTEEGTGKAVLETEPFVAGNDPPEILTFRADARSGVIPLVISIADSTSDTVTIEATMMSKRISREDTAESFETTPEGKEHKLFWNSEKDFGFRRGRVAIEIIPKDLEEGPRFTQEIEVDNNSEPQVQIVDVAGSSDKSFEIPIRFILRDQESNPASVILQWAAAEGEFPDLPLAQTVADPVYLRDLLTSPAEEFVAMRRQLHILSEAPRMFRGVIDEADVSAGWIRESDFVREGLVFRPPFQDQPRPLGGEVLSEEKEVFLIGQEVRFLDPSDASGEGPQVVGSARITSFDPETSKATIADLAGAASAPPGTLYEIRARTGMHALPSFSDPVLHTFLWDSFADIADPEIGLGLTARVKVRAIGIDTESGLYSFESTFDLESAFLTETQSFGVALGGEESARVIDVNRDGRGDLIAMSPNAAVKALEIYIQKESGMFPSLPTARIDVSAAGTPQAFTVSDIDGDGREDVVLAIGFREAADGTLNTLVATYIQDRSGPATLSFSLSQSFRIGIKKVIRLAMADVLGDTKRDLVLAGSDPPCLCIYAGQEHQLSDVPAVRFALDAPPTSLAVGEIDEDGGTDIVLACVSRDGGNTIGTLLRRAGDVLESHWAAHGGQGQASVAIADLSEEMGKSILVANKESATLTILSSDLAAIGELQTSLEPVSVSAGDFDGDGTQDAMIATASGRIDVYLRGGGPMLPQRPSFDIRVECVLKQASVAVGDIDGDGRDDVVAVGAEGLTSTRAKVYEQSPQGSHTFHEPRILETGRRPVSIAIGDVNGDGRNDVVVANSDSSSLSLFFQNALGVLPIAATQTIETARIEAGRIYRSHGIVGIGDVDGDGMNDVAVANFAVGQVSVYARRTESGLFDPEPTWTVAGGVNPLALAIGDLDGDGRNELLIVNEGSNVLSVGRLDRTEGWREVSRLDAGLGPNSVAIGDLNGDGGDDVVVTADGSRTAHIYWQTDSGNVSVSRTVTLRVPSAPSLARIGDLDGDGRDDLLIPSYTTNEAYVYIQKGDGGISADDEPITFSTGDPTTSGAIADVDGDGRADVLISQTNTTRLSLFLQSPSGQLGLPPDAGSSRRPSRRIETVGSFFTVAAGDTNGDGRDDLLGVLSGGEAAVLYLAR